MADDTNYKKVADAVADGIARGIRTAVHKGLYFGGVPVTLQRPVADEEDVLTAWTGDDNSYNLRINITQKQMREMGGHRRDVIQRLITDLGEAVAGPEEKPTRESQL